MVYMRLKDVGATQERILMCQMCIYWYYVKNNALFHFVQIWTSYRLRLNCVVCHFLIFIQKL
jgi:hypothetical protein